MHPAWLQTLFRKWHAARGSRLSPGKVAFRYDWIKLLDENGLLKVEDRQAAERDLKKLPQLQFHTHKYRKYLIEKVIIPLESEPWLIATFGHIPAAQLHQETLSVIAELRQLTHPLYPELWQQWCDRIQSTFQQEKNLQPLTWKEPDKVRQLITLVHRFTSIAWTEATPIREASTSLGLGSKDLENLQSRLESCLTSFYERPTTLESCGLLLTEPKVEVAGKLTLHYADGNSQPIHEMKGVYTLPLLPDLERAIRISTPATRLLTVENSKTTLPALAAKNQAGDTLLIGCSFPNRAVLRLIELLPPGFSLHHFGDTDPAGFLILSTLRQKTARQVHPFLMIPREASHPVPLTEYDRKILPNLLTSPFLTDVHPQIEHLIHRQDKGLFEQETHGLPDLPEWPFYSVFEPAS
ncbi:Wadjet anti-phage system protein JetD domain-containing protein [Prosthecobacter sp. SYSU 5D2]|uniref:Wadjet anti-phage system protein JetD domain-containing protein n=1 Tax=Prosthecobacter sp. SYSU 5D2 TaxID=3134134 RepID=UPI0031FF1423